VQPNRNVSLMVDRALAAGLAEKGAFVTLEHSLSYGELSRAVNRMGLLLRALGVRREQRVLLVLDNTTTFPVAFLGAVRIGAVPVPVSVLERGENLRYFVEDSYAEVVVYEPAVLPTLRLALDGCDVRFVTAGGGEGAVDLEAALAEHDDELSPVATHPDDVALWLYTSGSTGRPKGAVHLHKSIEVTCQAFARQAGVVIDVLFPASASCSVAPCASASESSRQPEPARAERSHSSACRRRR
jgi:acyl-coenzyme A synthetase/AMP-(fatty) acid ligase